MKYGFLRRHRCPHSSLVGVSGDAIIHCGGWRLYCTDCGRYLDGPVSLAAERRHEVFLKGRA